MYMYVCIYAIMGSLEDESCTYVSDSCYTCDRLPAYYCIHYKVHVISVFSYC